MATMAESPDSFSAGAKAIRDSVKWLIASFGAVAAALIAGSQLSGIGKLPVSSARLWIAIGGGVVALAGIALAISAAMNVLTPDEITLDTLGSASLADVSGAINEMPEIFEGFASSVDELRAKYSSALASRATALEASARAVNNRAVDLKATAEISSVKQLNRVVQNVLGSAGWYELKRDYRRSKLVIFLGASTAAAGIGVFAWAANPASASITPDSQPISISWNNSDGHELASIRGVVAGLPQGGHVRLDVRGYTNPHDRGSDLYSSIFGPSKSGSTQFNISVLIAPARFHWVSIGIFSGQGVKTCSLSQAESSNCTVAIVPDSGSSHPIFSISETPTRLQGTVTSTGLSNVGTVETRVWGYRIRGGIDLLLDITDGVGPRGIATSSIDLPIPVGTYREFVVGSGSPSSPTCAIGSSHVGCAFLEVPRDP